MSKQNTEGLNSAQIRFCEEYIFDFNGARAYQVAYPDSEYDTAKVNASKLLTNANVTKHIDYLQANLAETAGISRLRVVKELEKMAFNTMADLHNTWMERKEFDELTDSQKACIAEIQTQLKTSRDSSGHLTENEYVKIKLFDKNKALESINKMLGYNEPERIALEGEGITPLQIAKASDNK